MKTLVCELESQGLSNDQIQLVFVTIHGWLDNHYPIMAKISKQSLAKDLGIKELSMTPYLIIDHN